MINMFNSAFVSTKSDRETKQVNVLGTEYTIKRSTSAEDGKLLDCDGYTDETVKLIVVDGFSAEHTMNKIDLQGCYANKVMRHELVHAFLFESGLAENSWAENEEIVDWIAAQFPKMLKAFEDAGCM